MSESRKIEIECSACGAQALLVREPVYEGFRKVGERFLCSACGREFPSLEEAPLLHRADGPSIFTEADRPTDPAVFSGDEVRFCRHCRYYVVNPFTQWCSRHNKEVDATDSCPDFERLDPDESTSPI